MRLIDINCDVGEGLENEQQLLPLISSCNIACGAHAGDDDTIQKLAQSAKRYKVKVGAHPSYPDKKNFGRVSMKLSANELIDSVKGQLQNFNSIIKEEQVDLHHIKAHGALYNDIASNKDLAEIFLKAIESYKVNTILYVPFNSQIAAIAIKQNFKIKYEAFADRNYNENLSLVSRKKSDAVIENPKEVFEHLWNMYNYKKVISVDLKELNIVADTFCVHGDTNSAFEILMYLNQELRKQNVVLDRE